MSDTDRENLETRVLVLAPTVKDGELTRAILGRAGIACVGCPDQVQLCEQLTAGAAAVLIAEEAIHGGDGCLVEWLGRQPLWSDLPVLILARAGADSVNVAWAMDQLGNVTVLERPARVAALVSVVRSALRARQRQYQLRDQLVQRERLAEHLKMAMAAANAGSWQVNLTTGEFSASDRAIELHGLPPGTHLNHERALACVHPDDRASIEAALRLTLESGQPLRHEHRVPQPDGSVRWVDSHAERRGEGDQACVIGLVQDITERKRVEHALAERTVLLNGVLQGTTDVIFVKDLTGRLLIANAACAAVLTATPEQVVGKTADELHSPDVAAAIRQHDETVIAGGLPVQLEESIPVAGEPRVFLSLKAPLRDGGGRVVGVLGISRDITERKRAEEMLRKSEDRFRLAAEAVNGIIYEYDFATGHVERQRGLYEVLGYHAAEVPPTAAWWREQTHPDDRESNDKLYANLIGDFVMGEYRVRHRDGRWLHVEDRAVLQRADDGRLMKMVGCTVDVTERKRVEQALTERTVLLNEVLEGTSDLIFVKDLNGRMLLANAACAAAAKSTPEQLVGRTDEELFPPDVAAAIRQHDEALITGGSPIQIEETLPVAGEARVFHTVKAPLRDGGGRVVGILGISRDITERDQAEKALRARTDELETLLETLPGFVWISRDAECRVIVGNRTANEFVGVETGANVSQSVVATGEAPYLRQLKEDGTEYRVDELPLQRAMATGLPVRDAMLDFRFGDGRRAQVVGDAVPLFDEQGGIRGGLAVFVDITDRKRTEEARHEMERNYRALAAASSEIAYRMSADWSTMLPLEGRQLVVSSDQALTDWAWLDLNLPPDEHPRVRQAISHAIAQKTLFELEHRVRRPDGSIGWTLSRAVPILDENEEVIAWFGAASDVTDRKEAHEAMRASESRLRRVFESNVTGMIRWDLDRSLILDANAAFFRMTGYAREDLTNGVLNFRALTPPEWTDRNEVGIQTLRTDGVASPYEKEYFRKDGSRVPLIIAGTRFEDSPSEGMSFLIDISDRKRGEQILRESEARLGGILRQSPAGIIQTDAAGCMTLVNPRWCEMLGYTETELLGRNILDITHPSSVAPTNAAFDRLAAGGPDFQIEKAYCGKDGSVLHVQSNVAAVRSTAGEFLGLVAVVLDLSERLRTEEELRRLAAELSEVNVRKDVFLATLAHELRNPLAPIRNGLQIMKLTQVDAATVEMSRAMMERQVEQMTRLIDDLMDVSRINQGKIQLQKTRMLLADAVRNAVDTSRPLIDAQGHELVVDLPPQPIYVDGDLTRLSQVFANLLNNSAKYTDRGGRIRLAVERQGSDAVVSVADNGVGISADMLARVFDMFAQIDRSLEKSQGGLGIGLNIVKRLVEMHGGSIAAESGGPGMGSTFTVRLPVALSVTDKRSDDQSTDEKANPAPRRRILVVDDNQDGASSLMMLLEIMGNETQTAHDGLEAVAVSEAFKPDVILMDIGMPKLNGYDACRRIRAQPWADGIVLVAMTGWGQEEDRQKSKDAGFNGHLVKPVEHVALMKLLANS